MPEEIKIVRKGEGEELHVLGVDLSFLCKPEDTGNAWSLMENIIPRDAGPPPHHHAWAEAYYLISGEVEFDIAGTKTSVRAGDFVYAPGGTVHAFRGISEEPSRMLIIDAPAHADAFFKQVDSDVSDLATDGHKVPAIGAANGIHFVPNSVEAA